MIDLTEIYCTKDDNTSASNLSNSIYQYYC